MSTDYITRVDLEDALRSQTDEIVGLIQTFMHQVDSRFNDIERSSGHMNEKYDYLI